MNQTEDLKKCIRDRMELNVSSIAGEIIREIVDSYAIMIQREFNVRPRTSQILAIHFIDHFLSRLSAAELQHDLRFEIYELWKISTDIRLQIHDRQ